MAPDPALLFILRLGLLISLVSGSVIFIKDTSYPLTSEPWFLPIIFIVLVISYKEA